MKVHDVLKSLAALVVVALTFTAASWFLPNAAYSHTYTDFYVHAMWYDQPTFVTVPANDRGGTFDFYHNGAGWTNARRDRNFEAVTSWNNVSGADFTWLYQGHRTDLDDTSPCNNGVEESSFDWTEIDGQYDPSTGEGSIAGEWIYCYSVDLFSGRPYLLNSLIRYDQEENWYTGTGNPGSNQTDFLSVATHETGHASGWHGHFELFGSQCPPTTDPIHVMCPRLTLGHPQMRTLMTHDIHTFNSAY